jgi:hypothetical protein
MKTKKMVKNALKHPERWSWAELAFFRKWLESRKARKAKKKLATVEFTGDNEPLE